MGSAGPRRVKDDQGGRDGSAFWTYFEGDVICHLTSSVAAAGTLLAPQGSDQASRVIQI